MIRFNNILKVLAIIVVSISLFSCAKPDWSKPGEPSGKKRAQQNVKDGKGVIFDLSRGKSGGDFLFASSNPLWRASLDTLDFMSLSVVDYAGGVVITDWYNDQGTDEAIKISIKFLTNEVRADALEIGIFKRNCRSSNNCVVNKIENSLSDQIQKKILKKAAIYTKDLKELRKKNRPEKKWGGKDK
ncbi:DUF3576 domain-containing protein [Pelagibacterales bacterium SAG-MED39]|nr:DUF3576 domain-containing protein [Pelagibacterales bacterium SAG-MED39]